MKKNLILTALLIFATASVHAKSHHKHLAHSKSVEKDVASAKSDHRQAQAYGTKKHTIHMKHENKKHSHHMNHGTKKHTNHTKHEIGRAHV